MLDVWIIETSYDTETEKILIFAKNKDQVGQYIKDNIKNLLNVFEYLSACNQSSGKIYDELYDKWFDEDFHDFSTNFYDAKIRKKYIKSVENVLSTMTNEEVVDELYGEGITADYDKKEVFIKIEHIPKNKFIYAS